MANYYTIITARKTLTVSLEEYAALKQAALQTDDDGPHGGFRVCYAGGEVFISAFFEDGVTISSEFLPLLGSLIAENGLEYLEFGEANTCDEPRLDSHYGTYFRIRTDGSRWNPTLTW
jgi:hypothetical protein